MRRRCWWLAAGAMLAVLAYGGPAWGEVRLAQDFDSGSLDVEASEVEGDVVRLVGRENFNRGAWKWVHFRAEGVEGRTLRFETGDHFATGASRLREKVFVYSYDRVRWRFFDRAGYEPGEGVYWFENQVGFAEDAVWVAYSLPYPLQRLEAWVRMLRWNEYVHPTASGNAELVVGMSEGGIDELGREIEPSAIYGFKITDAQAEAAKTEVVVLGGVHANETLANYVVEGLVDFLVGQERAARELRQRAAVYVYPMVNPDGRLAGYNRGAVARADLDTNRHWEEGEYEKIAGVRAVAEAMRRDTQADRLAFFVDFHSWTNTGEHFVITWEDLAETVFWRRLTEMEPGMGMELTEDGDEASARKASRWFAKFRLGADYAMTAETMVRPGEGTGRFKRMGRAFGRALHAELVEGRPVAEE